MKIVILLTAIVLMCASCAALPAEERAFAVALCVEKEEVWRVHGRIPTYQTGGGYMTVTGEGGNFSEALSAMDAAAPMRINLSQLRLLVMDDRLAQTGELWQLLNALQDRPDMRPLCAVALTGEAIDAVAEALKPPMGTRLSKSIDLMLNAGIERGDVLPSSLADVLLMGERQTPVLTALTLKDGEMTLAGGYTPQGMLITPQEIQLLSLLMRKNQSKYLSMPEGFAQVREASAKNCLSADFATARVELNMTLTSSSFTSAAFGQRLAEDILTLLTRLSEAGCDVLGLGRQAVKRCRDMAEWHALDWLEMYRAIRWEIAVGVNGPA